MKDYYVCDRIRKNACIICTSNFSHSRIHKIWKEQSVQIQFAGMTEECFITPASFKFIYVSLLIDCINFYTYVHTYKINKDLKI